MVTWLMVWGAVATVSTANEATTLQVERAITDAVRAAIGDSAEVRVAIGQVRLRGDEATDGRGGAARAGELAARPVAGARLGRPTRFTLYRPPGAPGRRAERVGYAVAEAHATIEHLRTTRRIPRGTVLTADDVVTVTTEVGTVRLRSLPTLAEAVGTVLSRPLNADALVERTVLRLPTLIRPGDLVLTRVRVGAVVVAGRTTATETGRLGEVIGLINRDSGRRLRGRVIAEGKVEVVQ